MRSYFPFIVIGLTTGAVYALASLGLVLTYRTSGVFNFGHGAIGMLGTYCFYSLRQHVPTAVALVITLVVVAPLIGTLVHLLFSRLHGAGPTAAIVASVGLVVGLQGLAVAIYGAERRQIAPIFPTRTVRILDLNVGVDQILVVTIALVSILAILAFFRLTHLGLQTRAVVDSRSLAGLCATQPATVTRASWMIGCAFAVLSGILFAPALGLDSLLLTLLVVEAFGAATVGRLRSIPITAAAAFGLGISQGIATKVIGELGIIGLQGLPSALPFLMLFGVLVFSKRQSFKEVATAKVPVRTGRGTGAARLPLVPILGLAAVTAVFPLFSSTARLYTLTATVAFVLMFASLSLLIGLSRQLSLCHAIFVAFGATTLAHLQSAGLPFLLSLFLAAAAMIPLGAIMAIPAIRLSSLYLGLATFGFGILAQNLLFPTQFVFGVKGVLSIERPGIFADPKQYFYFTLALVVLGVLAVELVRVTRLGRILGALADSPMAVESLGMSPLAARVVIFCLSAFLAALSGGLLGGLVQSVNSVSFTFFQSLIWVAVLVAAGAVTLGGSVLAAFLLVTVPAIFTSSTVVEWQPVAFGAGAILFAQARNGLIGALRGIDFAAIATRSSWRLDPARRHERHSDAAVTAVPGRLQEAS